MPRKKVDLAKIVFFTVLVTVVTGLSVLFGMYQAANDTSLYRWAYDVKNTVALVVSEYRTAFGIQPTGFLVPTTVEGVGVRYYDSTRVGNDYVFLTSFYDGNNEMRLIRRDGTVVNRWPAPFTKIFKDASFMDDTPVGDWSVYIHGSVVLPDGSVVFSYEYGGLVKLDRDGNVVWKLPRMTHHSVERAEGGGFWVCGRHTYKEEPSAYPPYETPYSDDTIMKVSDDGDVLYEVSVMEILYENGLMPQLTATGHSINNIMWDEELLHLNKIEELTSDLAPAFPMFEAGDLALSLRTYNLLVVLDPETREVKWWRIGPWLRQHDPKFTPQGTVLVYNNNSFENYETIQVTDEWQPYVLESNIMEYNPAADSVDIVVGDVETHRFFSNTRGKLDITKQGILVTSWGEGRVFEVDTSGAILWDYVNRYDEDHMVKITGARIYPGDYFTVEDWTP